MNSKKQYTNPQAVTQQPNSVTVSPTVTPLTVLNRRLGNAGIRGVLQAKLSVSDPQDAFEQEADRVADQVMRMADAQSVARSPLQIQRVCDACDEELHRSEDSAGAVPTVSAAAESSIASLSTRGSALPQSVRTFMEPRFQADFSNVRIHNDAQAHELAGSVQAKAFTVGNDVVFGAGHYSPESEAGRRLLAHELTHVLQQGQGRSSGHELRRTPRTRAPAPAPVAPAWLGRYAATAVHVRGEIWEVNLPTLGKTWVGPYSKLQYFINGQGFGGTLEAAHIVGGEHLEDTGSLLAYDAAPCVAIDKSLHSHLSDATTKYQKDYLAGRATSKAGRTKIAIKDAGALFDEVYSGIPELREMAHEILRFSVRGDDGHLMPKAGTPMPAKSEPMDAHTGTKLSEPTSPMNAHDGKMPKPSSPMDAHQGTTMPKAGSPMDAHQRTTMPEPTPAIDAHQGTTMPKPSSPMDAHQGTSMPKPRSPMDAHEGATRAEVGMPLEPVTEATPGFKAEAASGIGGAIQLIQAMQFAQLQKSEVEKFAKRYEELQPKIEAFLANGYSVELLLIVEKPDRPDIFCATGAFCDSGQFIYFHDLYINYVDTPSPIVNVKPREKNYQTYEPVGGGGGFAPRGSQGGGTIEEKMIPFMAAKHAEHHCVHTKYTLFPQASFSPIPTAPRQQPAPPKPKPKLSAAEKQILADGPARVYALSANVVQYKTAAEVIKKLSGNPLFGEIKEYTGGGIDRGHTIIDYRNPLDKAKAEALAEIVRAAGVPTATVQLTDGGEGDPGVLQIWFGRDAEK